MQVQFLSQNPRTEELLARFDLISDQELEHKVEQAANGQRQWLKLSLEERANLLRRVGERLLGDAPHYAALIESEMGKLYEEALGEVKKCADLCIYTADQALDAFQTHTKEAGPIQVSVKHEALGVILAVMPWNFPFWQVFRAGVPLLLSGNTLLLKHAPNTPQCSLAIEKIFAKASPTCTILTSLFIDNDQIQRLIAHKTVKGVTLTGSKRAGIAVATAAAMAVKPCVLELGGSDPFIVFADANLENAVEVAVNSRCLSNGQSCIAAKRFLIESSVFARFTTLMTAQMNSRVIGPLANRQQQQTLKAQVDDALAKGATLHCGGAASNTKGFFYAPTVLSNLTDDMRVSKEEVFGPVACVWPFENDDEALARANTSDFGLGATLFTSNAGRIERFTLELEAGQVFVNDMVRSDPRYPFGGIKESGVGRELGPRAALSFTNEKTVWIKPS